MPKNSQRLSKYQPHKQYSVQPSLSTGVSLGIPKTDSVAGGVSLGESAGYAFYELITLLHFYGSTDSEQKAFLVEKGVKIIL